MMECPTNDKYGTGEEWGIRESGRGRIMTQWGEQFCLDKRVKTRTPEKI